MCFLWGGKRNWYTSRCLCISLTVRWVNALLYACNNTVENQNLSSVLMQNLIVPKQSKKLCFFWNLKLHLPVDKSPLVGPIQEHKSLVYILNISSIFWVFFKLFSNEFEFISHTSQLCYITGKFCHFCDDGCWGIQIINC